jgi:toxin ParE1/3/4
VTTQRSVSFAESAVRDLEEIRNWYVLRGTAETGVRLVRDLVDLASQLAYFPESGRVVPEFEAAWLRELIHPPFRLVYRLDGERVRVVRVWRSQRMLTCPPESE